MLGFIWIMVARILVLLRAVLAVASVAFAAARVIPCSVEGRRERRLVCHKTVTQNCIQIFEGEEGQGMSSLSESIRPFLNQQLRFKWTKRPEKGIF